MDIDQVKIFVFDRRHPDFEQSAWPLRRMLTDLANREFAKWVVSPERGRFLVYTAVSGYAIEQILMFTDDEDELVELVMHKCRDLSDAGVGLAVLPDVDARIRAALRQA